MFNNFTRSAIPSFKRWARTGWAAFASMHKVVCIGTLSVGMSILTLPFRTALAQVDSTLTQHQLYLKEVTVMARRSNPTRGIILPALLYGSNQGLTAPLQTIEDALRTSPAVDLRERGAKGVQADISLYGGTADQTMVMLNGINFTDARTGHQSHSLPIDIEGINGIHLIDGVPGIGAFTGAVNIIAAPVKPNYVRAELSAGQYGYLYGNVSGAVTRQNVSALVMGSVRKSDGYIPNTDFNNTNLYSRITYESAGWGMWDFQMGWQQKFFGANEFYSFAYPNQSEQTSTALASLRWKKDFGTRFQVNADLSYRKNYDRFDLFREGGDTPSWYTGANFHNTDNVGAGAGIAYSWAAGVTSAGVDYMYHHIYSNVLGEALSAVKPVKGQMGQCYTKGKDRSVLNGFLRHSAHLGRWNLQGAYNYGYSPYGAALMWSLASAYDFARGWTVRASAVQSMRLPTFTDLYYTTATHTGNMDLRPEKARTYKLALDYGGDSRWKASAAVYYRHGRDLIDWVRKFDADKWESQQLTSLHTLGAECSLGYGFEKVLKDVSFSYGYVHNNKNSGEYISRYALDYLRHKLSLRVVLELARHLTLDLAGSWNDRNGSYLDKSGATVAYTPYFTVNGRVNWTVGAFTFFVDATNLLDARYSDFGGMQQAGRWVSGGVRVLLER